MSFYMTVNSDANLDYFPDNKPYHFKTHLQTALNLSGIWKVSLVDISMYDPSKHSSNLYIHSDICGESILDGEKENILRMIKAYRSGKWSQESINFHYISVNKSDIRDIEFSIKDKKGILASFLQMPVTITLHFRSYPFYQ